MRKYKVQLGSLVTRLMQRKITVCANSEEEAIEKATEKFYKIAQNQKYTEVGGTVFVDEIEEI